MCAGCRIQCRQKCQTDFKCLKLKLAKFFHCTIIKPFKHCKCFCYHHFSCYSIFPVGILSIKVCVYIYLSSAWDPQSFALSLSTSLSVSVSFGFQFSFMRIHNSSENLTCELCGRFAMCTTTKPLIIYWLRFVFFFSVPFASDISTTFYKLNE